MKRVLYFGATLLVGLMLQLVCVHYISFFGASPQILLLIVVAMGFLRGSLFSEIHGFVWGFMADAVGAGLFGMQSLLLAVIGYVAGLFRRRMASERPATQIVIVLVATAAYWSLGHAVQIAFEEPIRRPLWPFLLVQMLLNGCLATAAFWSVERWIRLWGFDQDHG